jgi:alpha-mannosidase
MLIEESINEVMDEWRDVIKNKKRLIFSFEERAQIRLNTIKDQIYSRSLSLGDWSIREGYYRDIGLYEFLDQDWRVINPGDPWGGEDVTAFFKRQVDIPKEWKGEKIYLRFYVGGDSLLSINGTPYHGLDPFRNEILLTDHAEGGESFFIEVESYVNWHSDEATNKRFHIAEIATLDKEIYNAYWDFWCAYKLLWIKDLTTEMREYLETHLWDALKQVPPKAEEESDFKTRLLSAQNLLIQKIYTSELFKVPGHIHLVGHSHLDLVFMWTYREFIRKVGRTHATMLRLMEQYPEFRFCQSQAKTYQEMKIHHPHIYQQVKQRIEEERWEVIGGFWVEPDCNLISGESFVRQILHGQKFFQQEFGLRSRTCWQPDVFGMSASMPQILKRSGIEYVMTTKMFIWNDTNPWRKNTFWWEGIDGSRILTVVTPSHFIGMVDPDHLHDHWYDFSDRETIGESMYCFGWGDGGGGVDVEMLESARRYQHIMGLPQLKQSGAEEALTSIRAKAEEQTIPIWRDELYLEAHRGTATNKGILKKLNRQGEFLIRETELGATIAWLNGASYPTQELNDVWEILLTTQFHDSLPGTHINEVLGDLLKELEQFRSRASGLHHQAFTHIFRMEDSSTPETLTVFNSFLHPRESVILLPKEDLGGKLPQTDEGIPLPNQNITGLDGKAYSMISIPEVPGVGYRSFLLGQNTDDQPQNSVQANETSLENDLIRVTFNQHGEIISLLDKELKREVIVQGECGNRFQLYEDIPGKYDAWDIVASYTEHEINISGNSTMMVDENGPLRASLRLEKTFLNSRIIQRISLYANSRQLVFETIVDWAERQKLLKVGFPLEINTTYATYDIAYGNLQRPTHRNTSYDAAKFEVPAHKWMDVSQGDYGVSLLNDCKYGHEANGKNIRLSLLKGSVYPDEHADLGQHQFTYVLYPHPGSWEQAGTIQQALNLNHPLLAQANTDLSRAKSHSFLSCKAENITLEAFKQAEDENGVILRLVERHNTSGTATLVFDRVIEKAWVCDLMENSESEIQSNGKQLSFKVAPFEIVTLRVCLGE